MFKVGDYVTRNSYNNDIVFEIVEIDDNICVLRGISVRLCADSDISDLRKYVLNNNDDEFNPSLDVYNNLDRDEFFYLPGKILHFDSDKVFLDKCMKFYKNNKIKAFGVYMDESDLSNNIITYLNKYNPDILVLTGHDALYRTKRNDESYKNTSYFISAVKEARKYEKAHDKLFIVAGACQSNYEELIKAGANFASSPTKYGVDGMGGIITNGTMYIGYPR